MQVNALEEKVRELDLKAYEGYKKDSMNDKRRFKKGGLKGKKVGKEKHEEVKGFFGNIKSWWNYGWNSMFGDKNSKQEWTGEGDEYEEESDD